MWFRTVTIRFMCLLALVVDLTQATGVLSSPVDAPSGSARRPGLAIGNGSYPLLVERTRAAQSSFFVYQNADSGLNHGFPSGVFGNTSPVQVQIDTGCVDDLAAPQGCSTDPNRLDRTRGTVFRLTFGPLATDQFHGLTIEEPRNWGAAPGGLGYDLRGATQVTFDARSPQGVRVQFGVDGGVTGFVTVPTSWTTLTYRFGVDLPPLAHPDNVHQLFTVVTNVENAPSGGSILLDNIRFEPVPTAQQAALSLPLSTQTFGVVPATAVPIPPDQVNRNPAAIYEAALVVFAFLDRGTPDDLADVRRIADALSYALHHDNHGDPLPIAPDTAVGLHNAYEAGDLALRNGQGAGAGQAGDVRLAGFSAGTGLCGPSGFCLLLDGATGGNNAFAILALLAASERLGDARYLDDALTIGRWIEGNLRDRSATSYGGYFLGYQDAGVMPKLVVHGKSVENNADLFSAFSGLARAEALRGNTAAAQAWTERATWAGDFVMRMFDAASGRFLAGTVPVGTPSDPQHGACPDTSRQLGSDIANVCDFLDADTFVVLALAGSAQYQPAIDWRRPVQYARTVFARTVSAGGQTFAGFSLIAGGTPGIAWEFTGQLVQAMRLVDGLYGQSAFASDIATYLAEIRKAQLGAPFGDSRGLVAATIHNGDALPPAQQCLDTPFQCVPMRVGLAATTWAIFAENAVNPLAVVGSQPDRCQRRANVVLSTTAPGGGVLNVVVSAQPSALAPNNLLRDQIAFVGGSNATVEIGGQVRTPPFTFPIPPPGVQQQPFVVHRVAPGPFRIDLIARDVCGDWRSFVGGGVGVP